MSNDHALFIIIVPNDFDQVDNAMTISPAADGLKQSFTPSSVDTISALMAPAAIPLPSVPALSSFTVPYSNEERPLSSQPSSSNSMCLSLQNYFADRDDVDAVWTLAENKKLFQITYCVEFGFTSDQMLQDLTRIGVGIVNGSKVIVVPTTVILSKPNSGKNELTSPLNFSSGELSHATDTKSSLIHGEGDLEQINGSSSNDRTLSEKIRQRIKDSDFKKSVRARLMVHQVVASIRASSALSFDFVVLICLASMLAAFGLLESSTVTIVASMLVSPLMNPIMGIVFGLSVRDHSLWQRGLRNEIIGLIICISCGFLIGLCTTVFETRWGSSSSFPTSEMRSRGDIKRLWVGVFIALPSGAGVALSVLGGNTGSLVGVAISASLLPPAVNCGLLSAYTLLSSLFSNTLAVHSPILNNTSDGFYYTVDCVPYVNNDYVPLYTCNLILETAILALCSLLLTIVNILCIIIMALFILRIKEVVPLYHSDKDVANFFHHDVKVARDYNKTIHEGDLNTAAIAASHHLAQSIVNRWKTFKSTTSHNAQQPAEPPAAPPLFTTTDLESAIYRSNGLSQDMEARRKLFRLKTFAKEYDLDVFHDDDYNLSTLDSRDKVRLLVSDLIDICQEIPAVFIDLYRLQPSSTQTSSDREHLSFYQEIIELLPPKWYQLFIYERQRRHRTAHPLKFDRSYPMRSHPLGPCKSLAAESIDDNDDDRRASSQQHRVRFQRQSSVPESNLSSTTVNQTIEVPLKGTRFRVVEPVVLINNPDKRLQLNLNVSQF